MALLHSDWYCASARTLTKLSLCTNRRNSWASVNLSLPIRNRSVFLMLVGAMLVLFALCWPTERSFDLWVFKDRGSFLHLDVLLDQQRRIGVDSFYIYGLLPVALQRVLFNGFGRGPLPIMGCHLAYLLLSAAAWTCIVQKLSRPRLWTIVVMVLVGITVWVNPNLPYVLVQLSLLYCVACLLHERYALAIAVSAIGCWSVPTVTLLASALLVGIACLVWFADRERSTKSLLVMLAPGAVAYVGTGILLGIVFGVPSVIATALPFQGMAFYKTINFGMFTTLRSFLLPATYLGDSPWRYYICDRATWWVVGVALLTGLGLYGAVLMAKARRLDPGHLAVVFCAIVHAVFVLFAYGTPPQHIIYDPLIIAGVIIGLDKLPLSSPRSLFIAVFVGTGALSQLNQASFNYFLWRTTRASHSTADFYAPADMAENWSRIVALSQSRRTLLLSYSTGIKDYFPTVDNADVWTLQAGEIFESERQQLLVKMRTAEVIVEDLSGPTELFDADRDVVRELERLCLIEKNAAFVTWQRPTDAAPCPGRRT
jgi:hypothetical protein